MSSGDKYNIFDFTDDDDDDDDDYSDGVNSDDAQIVTGVQLAKLITKMGEVIGWGPFKGTMTIRVKRRIESAESGQLVDFCIGRQQGLRLMKKKVASTSVTDVENVLPTYDGSPGVFHLLTRHSDALYTIKLTKKNWYDVDIYKMKCHACSTPTSSMYSGPSTCAPLQ
jgi:hypothetical protein